MRLPLAFAVLLLASSQALGEEMGTTDDLSYWSDWSDSEQAKVSPGGVGSQGSVRAALSGGSALSAAAVAPQEELPLPLEHFLQRMARRPRPQQFFGLMGKRDAGEWGGGWPLLPVPAQTSHGYRSGFLCYICFVGCREGA